MNGIAEWRPVNPRGSDITTYRLEAEAGGVIQLESPIKPSSPGNITIDLKDEDLTSGVEYIVRVYACALGVSSTLLHVCLPFSIFHSILPFLLNSLISLPYFSSSLLPQGVSYDHVELNFFLNGKSQ